MAPAGGGSGPPAPNQYPGAQTATQIKSLVHAPSAVAGLRGERPELPAGPQMQETEPINGIIGWELSFML